MPEFFPETVRFSAPEWYLPAALLMGAVLVTGLLSYARRGWSATSVTGLLLRLVAAACLCFCLLQPMRRRDVPQPGANVMAVVVDSSKSMTIRPTGGSQSRFERIQGLLPSNTAWQARLAQDFDVRRYTFDSGLRSSEDLGTVTPDGRVTDLQGALTTLASRFGSRPVAGVILLTDGITSTSVDEDQGLGLGMPVHVVVDDEETVAIDISVESPNVAISSFDLAPITIECTVNARGLPDRSLVVRVIDEAGATIEEQFADVDGEQWGKRFRFRFRPEESGLQFVTVQAGVQGQLEDDGTISDGVEVTTKNNSRLVAINRTQGPFRVLYVSGRPNWELKYLRRALEEDLELEFNSLIRVAREEPKFSFRDQGIADVNPLIAGFSDETETVEQYDEPVFTTIGPERDLLKAGFPVTQADLFRFHAIIVDDMESAFFKTEQQLQIREFVSRRGGGFMMLGGIDSFEHGQYQDTPISELLPFYLDGPARAEGQAGALPARLSPTRDGKLQTWLRLRADKAAESKRFDAMPSFQIWNQTGRPKPGATVFAELTGDGRHNGLVGQNFGRGRALALTVGDYWRWGLERKDTREDDLGQFWRQSVRWLTNDAPSRVEAEISAPDNASEPHRIRVQVLNAEHEADEGARVQLFVIGPDDVEVQVNAEPDVDLVSSYVAEFYSRFDGAYRCRIEVVDSQGERLEDRTVGWAAQPTADEFLVVEENRALLERLAVSTGGEVVQASQIEQFARSLPNRKVPITVTKWEAIWHSPWLLMVTVALLCTEWGLRRLRGMP